MVILRTDPVSRGEAEYLWVREDKTINLSTRGVNISLCCEVPTVTLIQIQAMADTDHPRFAIGKRNIPIRHISLSTAIRSPGRPSESLGSDSEVQVRVQVRSRAKKERPLSGIPASSSFSCDKGNARKGFNLGSFCNMVVSRMMYIWNSTIKIIVMVGILCEYDILLEYWQVEF